MERVKSDHRHPVVHDQRYKDPLNPDDIPMYNYGEDAGSVGDWWE